MGAEALRPTNNHRPTPNSTIEMNRAGSLRVLMTRWNCAIELGFRGSMRSRYSESAFPARLQRLRERRARVVAALLARCEVAVERQGDVAHEHLTELGEAQRVLV